MHGVDVVAVLFFKNLPQDSLAVGAPLVLFDEGLLHHQEPLNGAALVMGVLFRERLPLVVHRGVLLQVEVVRVLGGVVTLSEQLLRAGFQQRHCPLQDLALRRHQTALNLLRHDLHALLQVPALSLLV